MSDNDQATKGKGAESRSLPKPGTSVELQDMSSDQAEPRPSVELQDMSGDKFVTAQSSSSLFGKSYTTAELRFLSQPSCTVS